MCLDLLHVMADLVGDDVGLREVSRGAEAPAQLIVKRLNRLQNVDAAAPRLGLLRLGPQG
jgi:hypothetical protein